MRGGHFFSEDEVTSGDDQDMGDVMVEAADACASFGVNLPSLSGKGSLWKVFHKTETVACTCSFPPPATNNHSVTSLAYFYCVTHRAGGRG